MSLCCWMHLNISILNICQFHLNRSYCFPLKVLINPNFFRQIRVCEPPLTSLWENRSTTSDTILTSSWYAWTWPCNGFLCICIGWVALRTANEPYEVLMHLKGMSLDIYSLLCLYMLEKRNLRKICLICSHFSISSNPEDEETLKICTGKEHGDWCRDIVFSVHCTLYMKWMSAECGFIKDK